jgi:hypothetical protein
MCSYRRSLLQTNPLFAKQLNQVESVAEFASLVVGNNRRLCANTTLRILENLNNVKAPSSDVTGSQVKLRVYGWAGSFQLYILKGQLLNCGTIKIGGEGEVYKE